jgi:adenine-specific DNA-methyltransferase
MNLKTVLTPKQSLNKAYLKEKVTRSNIELFKNNLIHFIDGINEKESEEYVKNLVTKFLYDTYYNGKNQINTKGRIDLAIYEDKKPVVIIEAKRPSSSDMVSVDDLNKKATHELMLYYLQERVDHGNIDIKYLIITNTYEWFVFDASVFDNLFYKSSALMKDFNEWKNGQKARTDRDLFYNDIAKPFLKNLKEEIKFTWFDLRQVAKFAKNDNPKDDSKLIDLFKILSPAHLLKQPFANDSNSLDTKFYSELLHIIGLEEKKDGGKKLIQRKEKPDTGSLLENAINSLVAEDRLHKLPKGGAEYGDKKEERLFNVGLELCITWVNRILFLKLLEGQLLTYHAGDKLYKFLDFKTIPNYDELNKLFFQVLARKESERTNAIREKFAKIPYLNSSLFDISALEDDTLRINSLDDGLKLRISNATVLKTENGKKREGELPTLKYLFEFLDAYDFSTEGKEEIQEENKTLINASVLGLIFEKINGYKDGSFFTPGFITMYMCRETIRRSVVQKFNEAKKWKLENFEQLYNKIDDVKEANDIVNSLKICDPAVGSGHFLVSALNEIIAIKSELGILADRSGKLLRDYSIEVVNDELIVSSGHNEFFEYKPGNKESQRLQEALFHEKQTLIENCLFGVDINPNSVKICRLRLWIELLKNAYYTSESKYTELETLPNIDINIKQGNSLINRFPLDADLTKALRKSKWNIDTYKIAIHNYHHATSKDEKREIEKLIETIKSNFETEIANYSDPRKKKIAKLGEQLFKLTGKGSDGTGIMLFEPEVPFGKEDANAKKRRKEIEKIESEINKLAAEIEEIKSSAIYKDAFEWRFEFPEVLDNEGNFIGFDAVIGNPPYGAEFPSQEKKYIRDNYKSYLYKYDSYVYFIELGLNILKPHGFLEYITPILWLTLDNCHPIRSIVSQQNDLKRIFIHGEGVFDEAVVNTLSFQIQKSKPKDELLIINEPLKFSTSKFEWIDKETFKIEYRISPEIKKVVDKIKLKSVNLSEFGEVIQGITPYDSYWRFRCN